MNPDIDYADEYNNSARVADADMLVNQYMVDAAVYAEQDHDNFEFDLSYGSEPRNRLDIFWPGPERDCPMVVFIHGGYWQRLDRSAFSHMAQGLNERGVAVVVPSYTLCPDTTIDGIINEMRRACVLLFQTYQRPLTVIGHSAGGHLAACMLATDWPAIHPDLPEDMVQSAMGISGIYQLEPLVHTPINGALGLTEETAREASPVFWVTPPLARFEAWVGGDESSEYQRQASQIEERWQMLATAARMHSVAGANHFTIIHQLTNKASPMVNRIMELIENPTSDATAPALDEEAVRKEMQDFADENEPADREDQAPDVDAPQDAVSQDDGEQRDDGEGKIDAPPEEAERPVDIGESQNTPPSAV